MGGMKTLLEEHLEILSERLRRPDLVEKEKDGSFKLHISDEISLTCTHLDPGFLFYSPIMQKPKKNLEAFYMHIMQANYIGQGTGRSVIGMDPTEKELTFSYYFPQDLPFPLFKERLEGFLNYLEYWKTEIARVIDAEEAVMM